MNLNRHIYTGSVTARARAQTSEFLSVGDLAVDATAGRGHDCVELGAAVGDAGKVIGVDVQELAVEASRSRMVEEGLAQVSIIHASHEDWSSSLPEHWRGQVKAFVYNLGYLPRADHAVVTRAESTLASIRSAIDYLSPNGIIRVLFYRGHPGGAEEFSVVEAALPSLLPDEGRVDLFFSEADQGKDPVLMMIQRGPC